MCPLRFTETSANVICRELGFKHAVDWFEISDNKFPGARYFGNRVVLSNVSCEHDDDSFGECDYTVMMGTQCNSWHNNLFLAIVCNPEPGN